MARAWFHAVMHYLRRTQGPSVELRTDSELLKHYLAERDQTSFEVLVWRHGAMVLGVCERILGDCHDAEDAFQATFLVFVKKTASISRREALASWLYKVASRISGRLRAQSARLREESLGQEGLVVGAGASETSQAVELLEIAPILD